MRHLRSATVGRGMPSDSDARVLALGARVVGEEVAKEIAKIFMQTEFEGGRHIARNANIRKIEQKYSK